MWAPPYGPPHHGAIGEPLPGCPPRAFENLLLALITHCPCDLPIFTCRHSHFIPLPTPTLITNPPITPTHIYYFIFSLPTLSLAGLINLMEISSSQGWPPMFVIWFGHDKSESPGCGMLREQCHFSVLSPVPLHVPTLRRRVGAINLSHVPSKLISQKINFN